MFPVLIDILTYYELIRKNPKNYLDINLVFGKR